MSALLDSFASAYGTLHDADAQSLGDSRRQALDQLIAGGLPGSRDEAWKYTSLRALERRAFAAPDASPPSFDDTLLTGIPAPRLVFVNGRHDAARSDLSGLPAGVTLEPMSKTLAEGEPRDVNFIMRRYDGRGEAFARANAALAEEGVVLRVEAGVRVMAPLQLVFVGVPQAGDRAWHLRHFLDLRDDARLDLVERQIAAGEHAHLSNEVMHVHVGQRGAVRHVRIQDDAGGATRFARTDVVLARQADYRRVDLELGAALSRHELNVRLEGEDARLTANGVLLGDGRRHVDTRLGIEHIARDTSAQLLWRGIGADRSRVVFHGGIHIREGADGTDAQLSNKNLLLSANAEIDTQPVLVIDADEVQAAHGATVGQIDANALFYLRSRGLPQDQAQRLLSTAFCHEPLRAVDGALGEALSAALDRALASAGVA